MEIVTPEGLEDTIDGLDPEMYQAAFADVSMPNIKEGGPWNEPLPSERPASASSTDSEVRGRTRRPRPGAERARTPSASERANGARPVS